MISMGIPGSAADVILMAALLFHNIQPGPLLILEHPDAFYGIVGTYLYANVLTFLVLITLSVWLARMIDIPRTLLLPLIFIVAIAGIYSINNIFYDVWVMLGFGAVGFAMKVVRLPSAPFVIGFVLMPLFEEKLRSSLMESDGSFLPFVERPLALTILLFSLAFACAPLVIARRTRAGQAAAISEVGGGPSAP